MIETLEICTAAAPLFFSVTVLLLLFVLTTVKGKIKVVGEGVTDAADNVDQAKTTGTRRKRMLIKNPLLDSFVWISTCGALNVAANHRGRKSLDICVGENAIN